MKTPRNRNPKNNKTKRKNDGGGKTFSESSPVNIFFNNQSIVCYVCGHDRYTETVGTINKSKVRSGVGQVFFGDIADVIDNTSIIMYACINCGCCKMVRNSDSLQIISKVAPPKTETVLVVSSGV